jgi:hypothetical protein
VNPFFPLPIRGSGVISADLAIPDYRKEPLEKRNLFAIIEIKFQNDKIKNEQFRQYNYLAIKCGEVKTGVTTLSRTNGRAGVTHGCRVALFRYPEDIAVDPKKKQDGQTGKPKDGKPTPSRRTGKHRGH